MNRRADHTIRRATAEDADVVTDIYLRARAASPMPAGIRTDAEVRAHVADVLIAVKQTWLAVDDAGSAFGMLTLHGAELEWLFVAPEAQGGGVGAALLEHAKKRSAGLQLWVFVVNTPARRFYESHGFEVIDGTDGDNEEGEPDLRMAWRAASTR